MRTPEDLVDHLGERLARLDEDCIVGNPTIHKTVRSRPILQCHQVSLRLLPSEFVLRPLLQSSQQGIKINIKHEHSVE